MLVSCVFFGHGCFALHVSVGHLEQQPFAISALFFALSLAHDMQAGGIGVMQHKEW